MSSTFWFLLEFTVLLALTAACFGWLGWMWRGTDRSDRLSQLEKDVDAERAMARAAMDERDAARAELRASSLHMNDAERLVHENEVLQDANARLRTDFALQSDALAKKGESHAALTAEIEKQQQEIALLSCQHKAATELAHKYESALRAAQGELATLRQQIAQNAHSSQTSTAALESALHTAREQLSQLKAELATAHSSAENERIAAHEAVSRLETDLAAARAEITTLPGSPSSSPSPTPVAPAPKPRTRTKSPKMLRAATSNAHEKLALITQALAQPLATLTALTQERDDWQRRVGTLESQTPPDPAGLALARRRLVGSQQRLDEAQAVVHSLQNQQHALEKAIAQFAQLAGVPDDDLTKIKGIKKVLSGQLHALGIRTWRQIADWDDDDLRAFSELLAFKNRATRDHWREQAQKLIQRT